MKIEILGVDKSSILHASSLNINKYSKERRNCYLEIFSAASSYLPNVGQDLKVYDDDSNLIFGGVVKTLDIENMEAGKGNDVYVLSSIFSDGYNHIPGRRTVNASYSTSFSGVIVTSLLATVLNSTSNNEGIGTGMIDDGAYYEEFVKPVTSVKEIYDELAKASGFKWYIDDARDLYFEQESSTPAAAHDILSTGTFYDFHEFQVTESLHNYRNKQFVVGDIGSSGILISVSAESSAQIAARQTIEGGSSYSSGVYGNVIRDSNIKTVADALVVANNALKQYGYPDKISFKSYSTDWEPSTKLQVKLPKYGIDTATFYLIEEVSLDKINATELVTTIKASKRDPADFSSQKSDDDIDFFTELVRVAKDNIGGGYLADTDGNIYKVDIYVQTSEPINDVKAKSIWHDTDDYGRYDKTIITGDTTLIESSDELLIVTAPSTIDLFTASGHEGVGLFIVNQSSGVVNMDAYTTELINDAFTFALFPQDRGLFLCDGTGWSV